MIKIENNLFPLFKIKLKILSTSVIPIKYNLKDLRMLHIIPDKECGERYEELRKNKHRFVIFYMPNDSEVWPIGYLDLFYR